MTAPTPEADPGAAKLRIGVLVSGNGSNLQALIDACAAPHFPAGVALVLSDVPTAYGLERARAAGIPHRVVVRSDHPSRADFDRTLTEALREAGVQWVLLAGFMRLLGPSFLEAFPGRVVNIHPALLPSFPGMHAVRQALSHGVRITGCTVHLVDEGVDTGPILAQAAVPVLPEDTEASLAARVQRQEHRLYPHVLRWLAQGGHEREGRQIRGLGPLMSPSEAGEAVLVSPRPGSQAGDRW